jgi:tetratricopeptide (TPR) repeat protein
MGLLSNLLSELLSFWKPPSLVNLFGRDAWKANGILRPLKESIPPWEPDAEVQLRKRAIPAFEAAIRKSPNEWVYYYMLCSFYLEDIRYVDAVRFGERLLKLRPNDPRSTYALATVYRKLTHAQYTDSRYEDRVKELQEWMASVVGPGYEMNPEASERALGALGLTIDEAAEKTITLFEKTRALGVRSEEAKFVEDSLAAMYVDFPHLEERIKPKRPPSKGLFVPVIGKSADGLFNEATDHYRKLRYLFDDRKRFAQELAEIVRLCQMAIDKEPRLGDAYVLLANALSLAAFEWRVKDYETYEFLISRAAGVIHLWATEPIKDFPLTKNKQIALQLWDGIAERISELKKQPMQSVEEQMIVCRDTVGREALCVLDYEPILRRIMGE